MVAEHHVHFCRALLPAENLIESGRAFGFQFATAVAMEDGSQRPAEHAFIGGHPLHAQFVRNCQRFIGYASF